MSDNNNQSLDLFAIDSVQDLSSESAAAISGGIDLYTGTNFTGRKLPTNGVKDLSKVPGGYNNTASSIRNSTGKIWAFYTGANYTGRRLALRPGTQFSSLASFDNTITSYRSEARA
jgi:hypothetical protein